MGATFALGGFMSALLTFILVGAIVFLSRRLFLIPKPFWFAKGLGMEHDRHKLVSSLLGRAGKNTGEDYGSFANGPARWLDMV
jgi:hypothetical protein